MGIMHGMVEHGLFGNPQRPATLEGGSLADVEDLVQQLQRPAVREYNLSQDAAPNPGEESEKPPEGKEV